VDSYVDHGVSEDSPEAQRLERLWAPYRSAYLTTTEKSEDPFSTLPERSDEEALIVARGTSVYCVLNLFPYNPGHMMVVPYRRVADYVDLTEEETAELAVFTKRSARCVPFLRPTPSMSDSTLAKPPAAASPSIFTSTSCLGGPEMLTS